MRIEITGCGGTGAGILGDLSRQPRVEAWLGDMRRNRATLMLDVTLAFDGYVYPLRRNGAWSAEFDSAMEHLRRMPAAVRAIPSDAMSVKCGMAALSLEIDLDGTLEPEEPGGD